ncbi:nucleotidyl transferase AbiEii/AbiGii toxin family protein [uncultured Sphaerochaeta sp.]|uniref:nucleotidyl transferase AbiEii/AbiGii toxin family protein n=1 Tax=uncultured Sphaerochaeta sp. TaxID=886478 RepID=UPI0029CA9C81|nr:nucleotidyl transferase AbiEii/AbiGii toxin family protein [uncultured Sphaerochaeta sp.]
MFKEVYLDQVKLLIKVLPIISKEPWFALKGGTAINLFVRDLPRLSVDIDLTYLGFEERDVAIHNINASLDSIMSGVQKLGIMAVIRNYRDDVRKLICSDGRSQIKIEPNYTLRGYVYDPVNMRVSEAVSSLGFASLPVMSMPDLYGGKLCAGLDRQHPRDLFDIMLLMNAEGISEHILDGFVVALCGHNRPPFELLSPNRQEYASILEKEFTGMSEIAFTIEDCNRTFSAMTDTVRKTLTDKQRQFLLDFFSLSNRGEHEAIPNVSRLPALRWKQLNLQRLKQTNLQKFNNQIALLEKALG